MSHTIMRNVEDGQRQLAKDVGSIVSDAEKLLLHTGLKADGTISDAQASLQRSIGQAKSRLDSMQDVAARKAGKAAEAADSYVRANPWKALGIVAALAALAGVLIARNSEA
jgi:ElaB/YqjD/DUF883 family membrane-anchored ribosome-binding protein